MKESAIKAATEYSGKQQNQRAALARQIWLLLGFYFLAFFAFAFFSQDTFSLWKPPSFDGSFSSLILPLLSALLGAFIAIAIVFTVSKMRGAAQIHNRELLVFLGGGMLLDFVFNFAALKFSGGQSPSTPAEFGLTAIANLGVLASAIALGWLVARGLKKPSYLLTAAVVGALTDIYSVYFGPSKQVLDSAVFPYVGFQWGVFGQGVIPCVGAGDFIFLCLFFIGIRRFKLDDRKTFWAMNAAFALGFLSLVLSPKGIPALPFMSGLLLLVHGRELWKLQATPEYS